MFRKLIVLPLTISMFLLGAVAANAGGWAVTEFDRALPEFTVGEQYVIGFTVLQHGVTPRWTEGVGLTFTSVDDGTTIVFPAERAGRVGHFNAVVVLTRAGAWDLEVDQGFLPDFPIHLAPHPVGSVDVVTPGKAVGLAPAPTDVTQPAVGVPVTVEDSSDRSGLGAPLLVGAAGIALGIGLLLVWLGLGWLRVVPGTLRRRTVYKDAQPTPEAAWTTRN